MIKLGKGLIITLLIVLILAAFVWMMSSREEGRIKQPILGIGSSTTRIEDIDHSITGVKRFSDAKKDKNTADKTSSSSSSSSSPAPTQTSKPLPYPRISINYSIQMVDSIRGNSVDSNSTFVIVMLDIRNYGYRYFDAYPNNFRGIVRKENIIPLINISTGDTIDDVIPNNSRAKGDLVFLISKKNLMTKIIYSPVNKSENYYIMYKLVSASEMEDKKQEVVIDEEDDWR